MTTRARPEAAIRTFLIADIRGYTSFTAARGDEAASRLAAKFAEISREGVEAWHGTLVELRGDEALAVFGSARSALRAAVELQQAFAAESLLAPDLPLAVGIGLDAGEAVAVGEGYRGAALNVAARLCSLATAGQIVASANLIHLAGPLSDVEYAELGPTSLKGIGEATAAVSVIGAARAAPVAAEAAASHDQPPLPAELDSVVPLAGREDELRWLSWHWRRTTHRAGRTVTISGPAGIGKTRMATELAVAAHADGAEVLYLPAARNVDQLDPAELTKAGPPVLLVVDDLDAVPAQARVVAGLARLTGGGRVLMLVTYRDDAAPSLQKLVDDFVPADQRRQLAPLALEHVRSIAALYSQRSADEVPAELILQESKGVPAEVHRVASHWARTEATRRLGVSARRTSRGRRGLRAAETQMIDDLSEVDLARDRSALYGADRDEPSFVPDARLDVCPYKGLAPFEPEDADYFFGRDRLVSELIARLVGSPFLGIVGTSGGGKSSAIRAGLLPQLLAGVLPGSDQWTQVVLRPGEHPLAELKTALSRAAPNCTAADDAAHALDMALSGLVEAQRLLVVVDHFEELFTIARDESERGAFVELLTAERSRLKVVVAMRADHYSRCAEFPRLAKLLSTNQVLVGPVTSDELRAIVEQPARRVGLSVDAELTDALVAEAGTAPGVLPLLSTALLELWQARGRGRLTLAAFHQTGGVRGAVARLAEAAYAELDEPERVTARALFLRLAGSGEGDVVVRRRVVLDELDVQHDQHTEHVLRVLTEARLLTTGDGYVEVAHEALLREWPRLRGWLEEDVAGRQLRLHVTDAARDWHDRGRDPGDLYRGARLAAALDWAPDHAGELNALEREFIEESRLASGREARRQRQINRRLRFLLAGAGVFLVVAIGAGVYATQETTKARAHALYASSIVAVDDDPQLAILLALEGRRLGIEPPADAVTALHRAVRGARSTFHLPLPLPEGVRRATPLGLELSPDGRRIYVATDSRAVHVYDTETAQLVTTLGVPGRDVAQHQLGLALWGGRLLAYVDEQAMIHVWDLEQGTELTLQAPGAGTIRRPAFSADGRQMAVMTYASSERHEHKLILSVWDLERGELVRQWGEEAIQDFVEVHFHPDGQRLLVPTCGCNSVGEIRWFDVDTGDIVPLIEGAYSGAALSPDGTLIATAGSDRTAKLWNAETGELIRSFRGHADLVLFVSFSPDGTMLASTSGDNTTRLWDVESDGDPSGHQVALLSGQGGVQAYPRFSGDGKLLATVSGNFTVRLWDVSRLRVGEVAAHDLGFARILGIEQAGPRVIVFGRECAFGYCFGEVAAIDLASGVLARFDNHGGYGAGIAADGSTLYMQVAADPEADMRYGPIRALAMDSGEIQYEFAGLCEVSSSEECDWTPPIVPYGEQPVRFAASADGTMVAMAGNSGAVGIWNATNGEMLLSIPGHWLLGPDEGINAFGLAISSDGSLITIGTPDGVVALETATLIANRDQLLERELELRELQDSDLEDDERKDVARGIAEQIAALIGPTQAYAVNPWRVRFTPDDSKLVIASPVGPSRVFDVESREMLYEILPAFDVDVSADGTRMLTLGADGLARLWDVATGREMQAIPSVAYGTGVDESFASFAEDERRFYVSDSGMLVVLTLDVDELFDIARSRLVRELTPDECQKHLELQTCPSPAESTVAGSPMNDRHTAGNAGRSP